MDGIAQRFKENCHDNREEEAKEGIDAGLVASPLSAGIYEALRMGHVQLLKNLNTYSKQWAARELKKTEKGPKKVKLDDEEQEKKEKLKEKLKLKHDLGVIVYAILNDGDPFAYFDVAHDEGRRYLVSIDTYLDHLLPSDLRYARPYTDPTIHLNHLTPVELPYAHQLKSIPQSFLSVQQFHDILRKDFNIKQKL